MRLAREFIHRFAESGADWVKFQTTRIAHLRKDDPQYDWFRQSEFTADQFAELADECVQAGTQFLTTVYHAEDVREMAPFVTAIKVGSGEAGEVSLATAIRRTGIPRVFVGCGIVPLKQSAFLSLIGSAQVHHLHCVSRYPCPSPLARADYGLYGGWSDHCVGLEGAQMALLDGARIIEKHVCLPKQARAIQPWEADAESFRLLRRFADDDPNRFLGRWQA